MDGNLDLMGVARPQPGIAACLVSQGWRVPQFKVSRDCARYARLIHVQLALSDVPIGVYFLGNLQMRSFCFVILTDFPMRACRVHHTASHEPYTAIIQLLLCLKLWDKLR